MPRKFRLKAITLAYDRTGIRVRGQVAARLADGFQYLREFDLDDATLTAAAVGRGKSTWDEQEVNDALSIEMTNREEVPVTVTQPDNRDPEGL